MKVDIARWQSQPALAKSLSEFLGSATGQCFIALLRHHFRATPLALKIEPGVDYMQVNAFLNRDREAWTQMIDFIEARAIPMESKPPYRDEIRTLLREPEKEHTQRPEPQPQTPSRSPKPKPRKKK